MSSINHVSRVNRLNTLVATALSRRQFLQASTAVMASGLVAALAVVSVYGAGAGSDVSVASGLGLIRAGLEGWRQHGAA